MYQKESLKIALYDYQQNSKSINSGYQPKTVNNLKQHLRNNSGFLKSGHIYEKIFSQLKEQDYHKSWKQCRLKIKNLTQS